MNKDKLSKLNVNRGEMANALDRGFKKIAEATELEIDARIKAAFESHNRARHRSLRQWWGDFLVRARS